MSAATLRLWLIAILVVAAIVSVVANKADSRALGWVSFAIFLGGVFLYARWRRAAREERAGRVFDRESKTDEDRTRPDR